MVDDRLAGVGPKVTAGSADNQDVLIDVILSRVRPLSGAT